MIEGEENMSGKLFTPPCDDRGRSSSLILHTPHHSGREVVIEQVVEKATTLIVYPVPTCKNYS
jgi:hypothetical protein